MVVGLTRRELTCACITGMLQAHSMGACIVGAHCATGAHVVRRGPRGWGEWRVPLNFLFFPFINLIGFANSFFQFFFLVWNVIVWKKNVHWVSVGFFLWQLEVFVAFKIIFNSIFFYSICQYIISLLTIIIFILYIFFQNSHLTLMDFENVWSSWIKFGIKKF